jgi:GrpB-like predicted nucleotidyltransferase (UPF0157 family)
MIGGNPVEEVTISEHNSDWQREFEIEKEKIVSALKDIYISIEHIGSTSVKELGAKPVIDMMVGVSILNDINQEHIDTLGQIGYEYVHKPEFPERRFFRKGQWRAGTHHLHIYQYNSEHWCNNILFRDYLRKHSKIKDEYYQLKRKLAEKYRYDRVSYTKGKSIFIQSVIDRANKDLD